MEYRHKILIVDDDMISAAVEDETLSLYETAIASSGEEALAMMPVFRPDMMLLDVNMPGMDGYEVCRAVRDREAFHGIRILLISANMSVEERLRGYHAGADDYMVKPFSPDELRAKVEVFLKLKSEEEVDETKSNLLGLFTHETRTPLGVIIGLSDLLRIDEGRDSETRRCAQAIYENATTLHRFIEKATLLSRLKSGYVPFRCAEPLDLHLHRVARQLELEADARCVSIDVDVPSNLVASLDWELFDEAMGYVVENAVRFSERDGSVLIAADKGEKGIEIVVSDRGRGISPSWISNIFEEFSIQDIRHHQRGQGLSLAVVKLVVELHDGHMTVESCVGKGTSFLLNIPER